MITLIDAPLLSASILCRYCHCLSLLPVPVPVDPVHSESIDP